MDCPLNPFEKGVESVNPKEQGFLASDSFESVKVRVRLQLSQRKPY